MIVHDQTIAIPLCSFKCFLGMEFQFHHTASVQFGHQNLILKRSTTGNAASKWVRKTTRITKKLQFSCTYTYVKKTNMKIMSYTRTIFFLLQSINLILFFDCCENTVRVLLKKYRDLYIANMDKNSMVCIA